MLAEERKDLILKQLYEQRSVLVLNLSESMHVSPETIRKDLKELENEGLLKRVHGGAVLTKKINGDLPINVRKNIYLDSKKIIASKALPYIHEGDTIFLDSSSTSIGIGESLHMFNHLKVITNSYLIAETLIKMPNIQLILVGGNFHQKNYSFVGQKALQMIRSYLVDACFISCTGVNEKGFLTDSSEDEAEIRKAMIEQSCHCYCILDDTKIYRSATYMVGHLNQFEAILSNKDIPEELTSLIEKV